MYKLFLDDIRNPKDCASYMHRRIGADNLLYLEDWWIARDYEGFTDVIRYNGIPTHVSFDHDLGEDLAREAVELGFSKRKARAYKKLAKDGYECAKFLVEYCREHSQELPVCFVHSMNPVGTERIKSLLGL